MLLTLYKCVLCVCVYMHSLCFSFLYLEERIHHDDDDHQSTPRIKAWFWKCYEEFIKVQIVALAGIIYGNTKIPQEILFCAITTFNIQKDALPIPQNLVSAMTAADQKILTSGLDGYCFSLGMREGSI